jgi:DNA-binding MarR family transcriptional regulator
MKIEDALSTDKFEDEVHKAVLNIMYTSSFIQDLLKDRTDSEDITLQQYNVLRILRGQYPNPCTVNMIKERLLDRMSDVSRIIDRLIQKELVKRSVSSKDRRAVDILITKRGLHVLDKLQDNMKTSNVIPSKLTPKECLMLSDLLDRFRDFNED